MFGCLISDYHIYLKYWDTLTSYHTYRKILMLNMLGEDFSRWYFETFCLIFFYLFIYFFFFQKIALEISCKLPAKKKIHKHELWKSIFLGKIRKKVPICYLLNLLRECKRLSKSIRLFVEVSKNWWMSGKQCRSWSHVVFFGIWSGQTMLIQVYLS